MIAAVVLAALAGLVFQSAMLSVDHQAAGRPWPRGLGSVESVSARYPEREPNAAARRLAELALPLGIDFTPKAVQTLPQRERQSAHDWLKRGHESASMAVGPLPEDVARYLELHGAQLDAVRDHLLAGGPLAWAMGRRDDAIPNLQAHMQLARLLVVRGAATGSWPDLEAAWRLSRALQARPELISQLIALAIARSVNAAAWKMPLPAAAWLPELRQVDHVLLLGRGMQYDAWWLWQSGMADPEGVPPPIVRTFAADTIDHYRTTVTTLLGVRQCGFDLPRFSEQRASTIPWWNVYGSIATPNLASVWGRAFRYRAEREATMNALRVRAGEPIVARSECVDGAWQLDDGTLAFTRALPKAGEQDATMPLALRVAP